MSNEKEAKKMHKFSIIIDENGGMSLEDAAEEGMISLSQGDMMDYVVSFAEILKDHKQELMMRKLITEAINETVSTYIKKQKELFEEISNAKKEDTVTEKKTPNIVM